MLLPPSPSPVLRRALCFHAFERATRLSVRAYRQKEAQEKEQQH